MSYLTKTNICTAMGPQLGSQMQQYAGLYSLSKRMGHSVILFHPPMDTKHGMKLFQPFRNISAEQGDIRMFSHYKFKTFILKDELYDKQLLTLDPQYNWDILGMMHTYQYWDDCRNELLKEFAFTTDIIEEASVIVTDEPIVSMHVRRTDYFNPDSVHINLGVGYYRDALDIVTGTIGNKDVRVVVFSDDIPWCKDNIKGTNIRYSEGNSQYVDMCMMTMCDHNIIANSTFSWWGAYLNQNPKKVVVCPYQWVLPSDYDFINGNYFPPEWNSIKI